MYILLYFWNIEWSKVRYKEMIHGENYIPKDINSNESGKIIMIEVIYIIYTNNNKLQFDP